MFAEMDAGNNRFRMSFLDSIRGQIRSATITGTLTDAGGLIVPNAEVTLTDEQTNITTATETTSTGQYTLPYLQSGVYDIGSKVKGFAEYRQTGISLESNQTVRVDIALKLASVASAVDVKANAVQLQTDSSTLQESQQAAVVSGVPNITRNPLYYASLDAGVVPRGVSSLTTQTTWMNSFGIGFYGRMNWSAVGVNGGRRFHE